MGTDRRIVVPLLVTLLAACAVLGVFCWRYARAAREHRTLLHALDKREMVVLEAVGTLVHASRESGDAVLGALDRAVRTFDPAIDSVLAFEPDHEDLTCVYASGPRTEHFRNLRVGRNETDRLPARAAVQGHRALMNAPCDALIPTDRSALAAPMSDAGGLRAVVYVSSPQARPILAQDAIVRAIAHAGAPYAVALEREADRAQATYDGLTGLLTPRAFRTLLFERVNHSRVARDVLSLWFIDTDHFKGVNDTFGHAAGDIVLQGMANLLREFTVKDVDIVGRNGGDEFCALVFDAQKTSAIERAQAFCEAVRSYQFGVRAHISASIGVASFPYDAASASELLEVADAAMYHSKRTGRDRVSYAIDGTAFTVFNPAL